MSRAIIRNHKLSGSDRPDLTVDDLMFVDVIQHRFASREAAIKWYLTNQIPGFSGKTAYDLVHAGGINELTAYLGSIDAGIHA